MKNRRTRATAGEGVGVIVVKTEADVGVGKIRVECDGAQETFARADAGARAIAVVSAQAVDAREQRVAHAGVELHLGGVVQRNLRLGKQ